MTHFHNLCRCFIIQAGSNWNNYFFQKRWKFYSTYLDILLWFERTWIKDKNPSLNFSMDVLRLFHRAWLRINPNIKKDFPRPLVSSKALLNLQCYTFKYFFWEGIGEFSDQQKYYVIHSTTLKAKSLTILVKSTKCTTALQIFILGQLRFKKSLEHQLILNMNLGKCSSHK